MVQYALRDLCGFKNLEWYADNCGYDVTSFGIRRFDYDAESTIEDDEEIATDRHELTENEILNEAIVADTENQSVISNLSRDKETLVSVRSANTLYIIT